MAHPPGLWVDLKPPLLLLVKAAQSKVSGVMINRLWFESLLCHLLVV